MEITPFQLSKLFMLSLFLSLTNHLFCQEKQVSILPGEKIRVIDQEMAKDAGLFLDYPNFSKAEVYEIDDSTFVLEVHYRRNEENYQERRIMDLAGKKQFVDSIHQRIQQKAPAMVMNQGGRALMLTGSSVIGLSYYGISLPVILDVEGDTKTWLATYMLSAGASFALPYFLTRNTPVTKAQASMAFYGQTRGILHGISASYLFNRNPDERFILGMGMLGSIGEAYGGYALARKWDYPVGSASILQMGGDFGIGAGFLFSDLFGFMEDGNSQAIFSTVFAGSAVGLYGGKFLGDTRDYTLGDAVFFRSTVTLSNLLALTVIDYFEPGKSQPYTAGTLISGAAGSFVAWKLLQDKDFDTGEGLLIALGEVAGGLIGLGTGYLLAPDEDRRHILFTSGAIGAGLGYGLLYHQFAKDALKRSSDINLSMHFQPTGLVSLFNKDYKTPYVPKMVELNLTF